jgi:hypothetical protein
MSDGRTWHDPISRIKLWRLRIRSSIISSDALYHTTRRLQLLVTENCSNRTQYCPAGRKLLKSDLMGMNSSSERLIESFFAQLTTNFQLHRLYNVDDMTTVNNELKRM